MDSQGLRRLNEKEQELGVGIYWNELSLQKVEILLYGKSAKCKFLNFH